jgi:hypothetical protein
MNGANRRTRGERMSSKTAHRTPDNFTAIGRHEQGAVAYVDDAGHAAYIVRACNSHEQLVSALRGIVDECHAVSVPSLGAIAAAEQALALAEEQ